MLEKQPFRSYNTDDIKPDIFTIRLNEWERVQLNQAKLILDQPKDSTAIKTLADIGFIVIHSDIMRLFLDRVFKNKANNDISGAFVNFPSPDRNVIQKIEKL